MDDNEESSDTTYSTSSAGMGGNQEYSTLGGPGEDSTAPSEASESLLVRKPVHAVNEM